MRGVCLIAILFAAVSAHAREGQMCLMPQPLWPALIRRWRMPVKPTAPISSCFGPRKLLGKFEDFHDGVDFAVRKRTPVRSVAFGKVIWLGNAGCAGRSIIVEHRLGKGEMVLSLYRHLNRYEVRVGEKVRSGQRIALSGASGRRLRENQALEGRGCVLGAHLHLEFRTVDSGINRRKLETYVRRHHGHTGAITTATDPDLFLAGVRETCTPVALGPMLGSLL